MNRHITVRGIALHDGKLLCARLKPYKEHLQRDNSYWCLPGGHLEPGEPVIAGMEREMLEETGIKPVVGNLLYIQQFHKDADNEYLELFFHILNAADYLHIDLAQTTHGLQEIEEISFIDIASVRVLPEFLKTMPLTRHAIAGITKFISNL